MLPITMKGPKGIGELLDLTFRRISSTPIRAPKKEARKRETSRLFHPKNPPTMAASFMSPPPIASFLKTILPKRATDASPAPPTPTPRREEMGEIPSGMKLRATARAIPGIVITLGMIE